MVVVVHVVVVNYSKPDKSSFLILFLKDLKNPIVLYESDKEFQSIGAVNHHNFWPLTALKCHFP